LANSAGAWFHDQNLEASRFENFEHRNPVHAGRLHRDGRDADSGEPVCQFMEIAAERPKRSHGPFVSFARHGYDVACRTDVNPGGVWMDDAKLPRRSAGSLLVRGTAHLLMVSPGAGMAAHRSLS
jgi:hypothetical protein